MTRHEQGIPISAFGRDKRVDPEHRRRLDAAIHRQGRGWLTGRDGGRPWTVSRTNRVVACLGALAILVLLAPVLLGLALLVKFSSPGPVLF
ncbi:MAG: sugar transferase, partial [Pseudomonas sp.]